MLVLRRIRPLPTGSIAQLALVSAISLSTSFAQAQSAEDSKTAEEVIVTATFLPRSIDQIAGTVSVVDRQDIERQLIEDLDEITRLQPGITMDTAARGGNQGFSIRGIGGNRVLTVIDGIRSSDIYGAGPSSYGKDAFETDDLRAIEIIRGPASALYGADAMGGAVVLRTRDPEDYLRGDNTSALSVRSTYGSVNDLVKTGFSYAFQKNTFGTVIQFTQRQSHESEISGDAQLNPQEAESAAWLVKSVWRPTATQTMRFTIDNLNEGVDTDIESELSSSVQSSFGKDSTDRLRLSMSHEWHTQWALADHIETQLHWQRTDGEQKSEQLRTSYAFITPGNPQTYSGTLATRYSDFDFNQETSSVNVMLRKALAGDLLQHDIVYGLAMESTDTERPRARCDIAQNTLAMSCAIPSYPFATPEVFPNKTFPDTETNRTGFFFQDEISIGDGRLRLIPGVRHDSYEMTPTVDALLNGGGDISNFGGYQISDVDTDHTSLNFGALYDIGESTTAFVQYAEGYRPPNFDESNQAFVNLGHGYATVPNPDLKAESSRGLETGIRHSFANADVSFTAYRNRYSNFIETQMVGFANGISLFQDSNIGKVEIYGMEVNADWQINPQWQISTAMAWSRGEDETNANPLDSISPLSAVISTRFDSTQEKWGAETLLTLNAEQDRVSAPDRVTGDAYALVDVVAYYNFNSAAKVRLGVFNLLDEEYASWNSIKGLAATDTLNIDKAQAPGTHVRLSVNYEF